MSLEDETLSLTNVKALLVFVDIVLIKYEDIVKALLVTTLCLPDWLICS